MSWWALSAFSALWIQAGWATPISGVRRGWKCLWHWLLLWASGSASFSPVRCIHGFCSWRSQLLDPLHPKSPKKNLLSGAGCWKERLPFRNGVTCRIQTLLAPRRNALPNCVRWATAGVQHICPIEQENPLTVEKTDTEEWHFRLVGMRSTCLRSAGQREHNPPPVSYPVGQARQSHDWWQHELHESISKGNEWRTDRWLTMPGFAGVGPFRRSASLEATSCSHGTAVETRPWHPRMDSRYRHPCSGRRLVAVALSKEGPPFSGTNILSRPIHQSSMLWSWSSLVDWHQIVRHPECQKPPAPCSRLVPSRRSSLVFSRSELAGSTKTWHTVSLSPRTED